MTRELSLRPFLEQKAPQPHDGRHVMAQNDHETVVVYQAYRTEIGRSAAASGYFGGAFSLDRMSWIKTSFLWMTYCSGCSFVVPAGSPR